MAYSPDESATRKLERSTTCLDSSSLVLLLFRSCLPTAHSRDAPFVCQADARLKAKKECLGALVHGPDIETIGRMLVLISSDDGERLGEGCHPVEDGNGDRRLALLRGEIARASCGPMRAGPTPAWRLRCCRWSALGRRSRRCRCRRRPRGAACAIAGVLDRASRHPTRLGRNSCSPGLSSTRWAGPSRRAARG